MLAEKSALIIARSAQLRHSLVILLLSIPEIDSICMADDGPGALALNLPVAPTLVLMDYSLPQNEAHSTLDETRAAWPQAYCVILLDDEQDRPAAEAAGADVVLVKGILAARLLEEIEGVLGEAKREEDNRPPQRVSGPAVQGW